MKQNFDFFYKILQKASLSHVVLQKKNTINILFICARSLKNQLKWLIRTSKGLRTYSTCKLTSQTAIFHGHWQKTHVLWVKDKGLAYWWGHTNLIPIWDSHWHPFSGVSKSHQGNCKAQMARNKGSQSCSSLCIESKGPVPIHSTRATLLCFFFLFISRFQFCLFLFYFKFSWTCVADPPSLPHTSECLLGICCSS